MLKNIHFIYIALMSTLLGVVPLLSAASTSEIEKLRAAAEKGDPVAQKNLGNCYYLGKDAAIDYSQAIYWYRKSASQGYANAQHNLGNCYAEGHGVNKDPVEAVKWYRMAAEQGLGIAQNALARCYYNGFGVNKDLQQSAYWCRKAAEQGNPDAQYNLGCHYADGSGVEKNPVEAVKWYRMAAEQEHMDAQFQLAACYHNGFGVEKDSRQEVSWILKAAKQGHPVAQCQLGIMESIYCRLADPKDPEAAEAAKRAVHWFQKAAAQEYDAAQFFLGKCYASGTGVEKNIPMALSLYGRAAAQGFPKAQKKMDECLAKFRNDASVGNAEAQFNLSWCYSGGLGVKKDYVEAVKWCRKAAAQNHPMAEFMMSISYYSGEGVPKDKKESAYWLRKSAEHGYAMAQYALCVRYEKGDGVPQDYAEAIKWCRKAAENGYVDAQYHLAVRYEVGKGVAKDKNESIYWLRKAAERGHSFAQFELGVQYYHGGIVAKDHVEAMKWFQHALTGLTKEANKGDGEAQGALGMCYSFGYGVNKNLEVAVRWYGKAAEKGVVAAQYNLGYCYFNGIGVPQDYAAALKWWRMAAAQGDSDAQYNLGKCYYDGIGVTKDYAEAVKWFRKAAEQGHIDAQFNLGVCHKHGEGVKKDLLEASKWYRRAAEQGDIPAQAILGSYYANGWGVQRNYFEAVKWFRMAAEQGDAGAQCNLGTCYVSGQGVPKDYAEAAKWWLKAADQGEAMAQYNLGLCHSRGDGVSKNYAEAVKWYRKAAEQGLARAQTGLGKCFYSGSGIQKNYTEAAQWFLKAAEQGDALAQVSLGLCYYYGNGVPKDLKAAVKWFDKSASQGVKEAQNYLGNCYFRGDGVSQNHAEAAKWYRKAAEQGYVYAQFNLARCYANGDGVEKNLAEAEKWRQKALEQSDVLSRYGLSYRHADLRRTPPSSDRDGNPYYQLQMILDSIQGADYEFDELEKELGTVVPRRCRVGEMSVTADEIKFLILAYKLDCGVNAGKKEKVQQYLLELETLLSSAQIDLKKLSKLFAGLDFAALTVDIGMPRGYLLVHPSPAVIERILSTLKKYERGSLEYVLLYYLLGKAYTKTGRIELATAPLEYAFNELEKRGMKASMERAASDLSVVAAYGMLGGRAEESKQLAKVISSLTSAAPDPYHQAMLYFSRALHIPPSEWTAEAKREFENVRSVVIADASDDVQFFIAYAISAVVRSEHGYPAEEVLPDLEQAFLYRAMLWGDADAESAEFRSLLKQIDNRLNELKDKLLQYLSESGKADRFAYWNAKFELARQRRAALDAAAAEHKELQPLLAMVNRYLNAEQILTYERAKKPEDQDKRRIRTALKIKRELERQFEVERKKLSPEELKIFDAFLSDQFVIHPGFMVQWSRILPQGTACIQFLPLKGKVLVFIVVSNAPPFTVTIDLQTKGYSQRQFMSKLVRTRNLLSFNAASEATRQALVELYKILFSDLEAPLAKLKITKLIVNASGILRYIPFAALHDGKQYLVEKYQITNVTGLDLVRLAASTNARQFGKMRAAVFADPDGSLPSGRTEGKSVAGLFANSRLFVGDQASFDEFESMIGEVNFIHLATHAVLDPNDPQKSYIQFADGKKWYYSDMMGFNVENVDSIALSACSTAVSEKSSGDGIEGMAFRLLGSSPSGSILASFWKVDDKATSTLMGIYYKHIVDSVKARNALDRGGALREAQLKLLRTPETSHPYYWAAFTLFGDFR